MKDLYATLEVDRKADKAAIKRAYRRRVRKVHPDVNCGKDEEFKAVHEAYLLLRDDSRRKHYDETGEDRGNEPDNRHAEIATILTPVLELVLQTLTQHNRKITEEDVVGHMKAVLINKLADLAKARKVPEKTLEAMRQVEERLEGEGSSLLVEIARFEQEKIKFFLAGIATQEKANKQALEYLDGCKYRFDKTPVRRTMMVGSFVFTPIE